MEVALKILFVTTVFAISGFYFLAISDLQAKQGLTHYQISELIKAQDKHSKLLEEQDSKIVIQVDGRKRGILEMPTNSKEVSVIAKAKKIDNVSKYIGKEKIIKNIYIKNKLVNFITKK